MKHITAIVVFMSASMLAGVFGGCTPAPSSSSEPKGALPQPPVTDKSKVTQKSAVVCPLLGVDAKGDPFDACLASFRGLNRCINRPEKLSKKIRSTCAFAAIMNSSAERFLSQCVARFDYVCSSYSACKKHIHDVAKLEAAALESPSASENPASKSHKMCGRASIILNTCLSKRDGPVELPQSFSTTCARWITKKVPHYEEMISCIVRANDCCSSVQRCLRAGYGDILSKYPKQMATVDAQMEKTTKYFSDTCKKNIPLLKGCLGWSDAQIPGQVAYCVTQLGSGNRAYVKWLQFGIKGGAKGCQKLRRIPRP
ncbi:hypothetical protein KKF84_09095 [Myxococcota bacterium]|nr:hypothetical protein [Myxococcota bacterium]MBU1535465.1 hypothetical protein [Myxococcota bacterium]